jgi:PII-like signaling protein
MLTKGPARKVTIHVNEDTSANNNFLYEQVFQFLFDNGVAGATLTRAQAGFGSHHHRHSRESYGAAGSHLPMQIQFIESRDVVDRLLPALCELVQDGLIEMQNTEIVKSVKQGDSA